MKATIQTIPELLVTTRGNITSLARQLNASRSTIHKYARDFNANQHAIVNGVLMVFRGQLGAHKREGKCDSE